jgi:hypothetical protein
VRVEWICSEIIRRTVRQMGLSANRWPWTDEGKRLEEREEKQWDGRYQADAEREQAYLLNGTLRSC